MFTLGRRFPLSNVQNIRNIFTWFSRKFPVEAPQTTLVFVEEVRRFIQECVCRVGVSQKKSRSIADFLLAADYRGVNGSGLNRLEMYLNDIHKRNVNIEAEPSVIKETASFAHVNGNSALGVTVGNFCIDLAVEKARNAGIGLVVAKQSHHFGMAAWYVSRAMAHGYIGLVLSNGPPQLMSPGVQTSSLGANCIAFGAKGLHTHFLLDIAMSVKDIGAIEWAYLLGEGIPDSWAADKRGLPTSVADVAICAQRLFPAGEHKGYCMAAMIDLLCGVMSGAGYSTHIPSSWSDSKSTNSNLGQIYIAIDPQFFLPDFEERLEDFNQTIKYSCPIDELDPVKIPGDIEKQHMQYVRDLRALPYPNALLMKYQVIADLLCVKPIQVAFNYPEKTKHYSE
ncbi:uncharacterized protein LOC115622748 [Scaptodrosophila lebanonensis]|uniref:Uncharacterized protein LOC115622748 n=1 Tax=Drosophila lebanonensis TaxID=7225 RepID=A0A6J2T9G3_DROLE|nr:uncharacterized protein LOC115622748 [Scaptodrosophila lebanonensis]